MFVQTGLMYPTLVLEVIASNGTVTGNVANWLSATTSVQALISVTIGYRNKKQALTAANFAHWMTVSLLCIRLWCGSLTSVDCAHRYKCLCELLSVRQSRVLFTCVAALCLLLISARFCRSLAAASAAPALQTRRRARWRTTPRSSSPFRSRWCSGSTRWDRLQVA